MRQFKQCASAPDPNFALRFKLYSFLDPLVDHIRRSQAHALASFPEWISNHANHEQSIASPSKILDSMTDVSRCANRRFASGFEIKLVADLIEIISGTTHRGQAASGYFTAM